MGLERRQMKLGTRQYDHKVVFPHQVNCLV